MGIEFLTEGILLLNALTPLNCSISNAAPGSWRNQGPMPSDSFNVHKKPTSALPSSPEPEHIRAERLCVEMTSDYHKFGITAV